MYIQDFILDIVKQISSNYIHLQSIDYLSNEVVNVMKIVVWFSFLSLNNSRKSTSVPESLYTIDNLYRLVAFPSNNELAYRHNKP